MGKKPEKFTWPEAKKRCRLNQLDIEMAKRLGFGPEALIRAIPDPKQKWKLPVKYWIHELHFKRFGVVLGENKVEYHEPPPLTPEDEADQVRRFEEEMYWEDYYERNADSLKPEVKPAVRSAPAPPLDSAFNPFIDAADPGDIDDDVPF